VSAFLSNALDAAAHTVVLGWRLGATLVAAAIGGVVGLFAGWLALALLGLAIGSLPETLRDAGILLAAAAGAGLCGLGRWLGPDSPPAVLGSARWASPREVAGELAAPALAADPAALLVGRGDGAGRGKQGELLRYAGPAHLLTIAPTRSGKGVGTVLPNLLLANRSVICVDPKGENARVAARARRRFGPVFILDPFGASGQPSAAYDPTAALDPRSPDLAEDAATLADALVHDPPGQVSEAHWNDEARALIAGLLMHLACRGAPDCRGLAELRRLLTLPPREWQALLHAMMADTDAAGGLVARAAARQLGKADREAAGVLSSTQRHTHMLDSPRVAAVMARSDFRFGDLRTGTATVFLVLPPDRLAAYARWLRLLVAQAIQELARAPQRPGTPPVLLLLDEFAALGRLEPALQAAGLMAGLGVQLWPILQDLTQLRAAYGQSAGTFLANAGIVQASAPADLETAQWLSRSLGDATVSYETATRSTSRPSGLLPGRGGASTSEGTSTHLAARPLLAPDEAMRLPPGRQVLLRPGCAPALVGKLRHYADAEFAGLSD
jgi:type IV secretion system protein VirD4